MNEHHEDEEPAEPAPGARAFRITKGTAEQVVFENRHGRRAIQSVVRQARNRKRPTHDCPRKRRK